MRRTGVCYAPVVRTKEAYESLVGVVLHPTWEGASVPSKGVITKIKPELRQRWMMLEGLPISWKVVKIDRGVKHVVLARGQKRLRMTFGTLWAKFALKAHARRSDGI